MRQSCTALSQTSKKLWYDFVIVCYLLNTINIIKLRISHFVIKENVEPTEADLINLYIATEPEEKNNTKFVTRKSSVSREKKLISNECSRGSVFSRNLPLSKRSSLCRNIRNIKRACPETPPHSRDPIFLVLEIKKVTMSCRQKKVNEKPLVPRKILTLGKMHASATFIDLVITNRSPLYTS